MASQETSSIDTLRILGPASIDFLNKVLEVNQLVVQSDGVHFSGRLVFQLASCQEFRDVICVFVE